MVLSPHWRNTYRKETVNMTWSNLLVNRLWEICLKYSKIFVSRKAIIYEMFLSVCTLLKCLTNTPRMNVFIDMASCILHKYHSAKQRCLITETATLFFLFGVINVAANIISRLHMPFWTRTHSYVAKKI